LDQFHQRPFEPDASLVVGKTSVIRLISPPSDGVY
jgi:hypothetical protein